jgi:hypothetical protein
MAFKMLFGDKRSSSFCPNVGDGRKIVLDYWSPVEAKNGSRLSGKEEIEAGIWQHQRRAGRRGANIIKLFTAVFYEIS